MKKNFWGIMALLVVMFSFALVSNVSWALKNVFPDCKTLIENLDIKDCPNCGKIINKCLICGAVNPIKNDNCYNCSASLAESRVLRTIDKETREYLRLGDSDRAKIEVELGQIKDKIEKGELTPNLAARQVELLTKMDWWAKANRKAIEFAAKFPESDRNTLVTKCRVKSLRTLGFLAMQDNDYDIAIDYLSTALRLEPDDKKSANLLKLSRAQKNKK